MAKALTPIRVARSRRTSVTNVVETQEINFALGLKQGIELYSAEFGMMEFVDTPSSGFDTNFGIMELHARIGALEGGIDSFPADDTILNSSILAQAVIQQVTQDEAATRGGSAAALNWVSPKSWNYVQITGSPILLATNLTFRAITKQATVVMNGAQVSLWYRYVELSEKELAQQFALRR